MSLSAFVILKALYPLALQFLLLLLQFRLYLHIYNVLGARVRITDCSSLVY